MSLLVRTEWTDWANAWGLAHHRQHGWLLHNEHIVGLHDGLLVQVGWGGDKNQYLTMRVRFPRETNLEMLRDAMIRDTTLDVLPGKGAARKKTRIEIGEKKGIRLVGPAEFTLSEGALVWRRLFAWSTPAPAKAEEWAAALIQSTVRVSGAFDGRCEQCSTGSVRDFVLVDQVPMMLCSSCQQRLRGEGELADQAYDASEANHVRGALFAQGAAMFGAGAWATLAIVSEHVFAAAAIGIGALVAWAYRRGAGRVDSAGRAIGAALTIGAVVSGQVLYWAWRVSIERPDIGFRFDAGLDVYMRSWASAPGSEFLCLMFGAIGAFVAARALTRPHLHAHLRTAQEDPREMDRKAA
jgi:hypothetical protein